MPLHDRLFGGSHLPKVLSWAEVKHQARSTSSIHDSKTEPPPQTNTTLAQPSCTHCILAIARLCDGPGGSIPLKDIHFWNLSPSPSAFSPSLQSAALLPSGPIWLSALPPFIQLQGNKHTRGSLSEHSNTETHLTRFLTLLLRPGPSAWASNSSLAFGVDLPPLDGWKTPPTVAAETRREESG